MTDDMELDAFDFSFDGNNLYKEEVFSEMEAGAIRKLVPVTLDGNPDPARATRFVGSLQVMTPQGPLPIEAHLEADSLRQAVEVFPGTMKAAVNSLLVEIEKMAREERRGNDSRIIVPDMR